MTSTLLNMTGEMRFAGGARPRSAWSAMQNACGRSAGFQPKTVYIADVTTHLTTRRLRGPS